MEYHITEHPNCRREISIRFPADEITPKIENEYQGMQKKMQLPGFRKGKVPMNLIKKMYKKQIEGSIIGDVVNQAFKEIASNDNLTPIAQPTIEDYQYNETDGLSVKLIIDLEPRVELKEYKNIAIEKRIEKITEIHVDEALKHLQEENAMLINVEGGAKPDHLVLADFQELDSAGLPIIGNRVENQTIRLPKEESDEITRQLTGIIPGEARRIKTTSAEKDSEGGLQSQNQYWEVTAKEVQEKQLPNLDDEFAKDVGNYKDLEELRATIKERLDQNAETNSIRHFEYELSEELIKQNPIEIPEVLIQNYLNLMIRQIKSRDRDKKVDDIQLRESYRPTAIRNLKWRILRDRIAEAENIFITETEIEEYLKFLEAQGGRYSEMATLYRRKPEELENLKSDLLEKKVLDFLKQNAKVTEKVIDRNETSRLIV